MLFRISLPIYKLGLCRVRKMFKTVKYSKKQSLMYSARSLTVRLGSATYVFIWVLAVRVESLSLSDEFRRLVSGQTSGQPRCQ